MEPQIQYAKTEDGVNIAYYALGEGPTVVAFGLPTTHLLGEWSRFGPSAEAAARLCRFVRFDPRGFGMSDRDIPEFTLDAMVSDLEAVVSRIGADKIMVAAGTLAVPIAFAYAARHQEQVLRLAALGGSACGADMMNPQLLALTQLAKQDWELASESITHFLSGWDEHEKARSTAALMRQAVQPATLDAYVSAVSGWDVTPLLDKLRMPVLLIPGERVAQLDVQRKMAGRLADARLASTTPGRPPYVDAMNTAVTAFFAEGLISFATNPIPPRPATGALRTVLFTDLVGHTEMMSRLGDERGRGVLREHERITREVLKAHGGTEVKTMGDGFMASFGSVTRAVECAIALQRAFAEREGEPLSVRVGLNAGEPIEENGDLFGATVILASRIAAKAEGGEILVADTVRGLCTGKGFLFADRGEFVAKGIEDPVRVYAVSWSS